MLPLINETRQPVKEIKKSKIFICSFLEPIKLKDNVK